MKWRWLALVCIFAGGAEAQVASPFTIYVHDTTGKFADTPLPSIYQLGSTLLGGSSPTVLKMVNTSANTVYFGVALVSTAPASTASNPNFSVTGLFQDETLAPGRSTLYTVNFAPTSLGVVVGYLNLAFQVQTSGCVFSGPGTICATNLISVSTLNGTATAPQLTLSHQTANGPVVLTPSSSSPLDFGWTSLSSKLMITFTLTNANTVSVPRPAISLAMVNLLWVAFTLDTSGVPATIDAGQTANFTITFAPSQYGSAEANLVLGANNYPITGQGVLRPPIDDLLIVYHTVDPKVPPADQAAASPISFGQVTLGSGTSVVMAFKLSNPITSIDSVNIPAITLSGNAFSISGLAAPPYAIALGDSLTFSVAFSPVAAGQFKETLSIGSKTFMLTGVGVGISPVTPSFTMTTSGPLSSQQQATLTLQLSAPSPNSANGTITMQFTPTVANVTDDAAVVFVGTGGRRLSLDFAAGAQTATYNNQSSIAFQTGTTAGNITFTVNFASIGTYTQTFNIPAALPRLTNVGAVRSTSSLLVVSVTGCDNTYSAGMLSFTFYDTNGKTIGAPITYDATKSFQQLFYSNNQNGGVFNLEAKFPLTSGTATQVGSVTVGLTNSVGQGTSNVAFQ